MSSPPPRAALAVTLAPTLVLGCADDDVTAPTLEHAELRDPTTLRLRFSEPLAPVDAPDEIDPSSHFRLSAAFALADRTLYYDLSYHFTAGGPAPSPNHATWPRHGTSTITRIELGDDPSELWLTLAYPLEHYVCDELAQAEALDIPAGIQLHYAAADHPRVTDEAGNPLAELGAWWVEVPGIIAEQPGVFPELDVRVPIACP
jgi:hypothetical protein